MQAQDPFPRKLLLTPAEVRQLCRLTDPKDFDEWVATQPNFPKPCRFGQTPKNKKPRFLYKKEEVYDFLRVYKV